MTLAEQRQALHRAVATQLLELEDLFAAMGLREITKLTLIARDPSNADLAVWVSNDDLDAAYVVAKHLETHGTLTGGEG